MNAPPPQAPPVPPTPRARLVVGGLVALLGIVTTASVSIAIDRALHGRAAVEADEHAGHDDEHGGHGDGKEPEGPGEGHEDHAVHTEEGEKGKGETSKHGAHVDVATVKLTEAQRATAKLEMSRATAGRVDEIMTLPGEVAFDADRVAHVTPRSEGSVREVKVDLGDTVKKGDVLAILDSREVAGMQQEVMAARARRELAEANLKRIEPLHRDGITSEKDHLAARQVLAEAKIAESSAGQKLAAGAGPRASGSGLSLVAPLDGTIVAKHITIGEVLAQGTEAFTIADASRLWIWSTAHARELSRVRKGQRAYLRADGIEEPLLGTVDFVESMLGEKTRTARARIVVESPSEGWRPGMFVDAELVVGEIDAPVVVREDAIQRLGDHPVVFVEDEGRFEARPVELGKIGRDAEGHLVRAIETGLSAGDSYVAKNAFILKAELGKGSAAHEH